MSADAHQTAADDHALANFEETLRWMERRFARCKSRAELRELHVRTKHLRSDVNMRFPPGIYYRDE